MTECVQVSQPNRLDRCHQLCTSLIFFMFRIELLASPSFMPWKSLIISALEIFKTHQISDTPLTVRLRTTMLPRLVFRPPYIIQYYLMCFGFVLEVEAHIRNLVLRFTKRWLTFKVDPIFFCNPNLCKFYNVDNVFHRHLC